MIAISLTVGPMLLSPGEITTKLDTAAALRTEQQEANEMESRAIRNAARELSESEVALSRVEAACVTVVDEKTFKVARLTEGESVSVVAGENRTLDDGTLICNALGDTAEVWDGVVKHVARIAPADKGEYENLFNQQFGEQDHDAGKT
ncbi:hypothetical protein D0962_00100 [Leptolyngbyaceae cyanobacterium CCMR0082]|uniref:Uncharacterized protein n=2 Tax=Adonisia TaxID=2950183 RepID=A0A6M0RZ62_9CYAN|nr:hypothetical protein [Adonisia turfae CCMR0082]